MIPVSSMPMTGVIATPGGSIAPQSAAAAGLGALASGGTAPLPVRPAFGRLLEAALHGAGAPLAADDAASVETGVFAASHGRQFRTGRALPHDPVAGVEAAPGRPDLSMVGAMRADALAVEPTAHADAVDSGAGDGEAGDGGAAGDEIGYAHRASPQHADPVRHGVAADTQRATAPVPPPSMAQAQPRSTVPAIVADLETSSATAAAATNAWPATPVTTVAADSTRSVPNPGEVSRPASRSLETLAPEFRERLGRVLDRLERDHGYDVQLLETYRTPERQDFLYGQGRTREGPVVTWTRESQHSQGLAADLRIAGPDGPAAYERMATIAAEEGLRTLGARDPGHVELATPRATADRTTPLTQGAADDPAGRVLAVARSNGRVAPTAADVRAVAQDIVREAIRNARTAAAPATAGNASAGNASAGNAPAAARNAPAKNPIRTHAADKSAPAAANVDAPASPSATVATSESMSGMGGSATPVRATESIDAAALRERVERVLALQESIAAQPAHSVMLQLDDAGDPLARIRVGLRGTAVDARLDVMDPGLASALRADLPELQRALERRGFDAGADPLRVFASAITDTTLPVARTATDNNARWAGGEPPRQHQHNRPDGQPRQQNARSDKEEK